MSPSNKPSKASQIFLMIFLSPFLIIGISCLFFGLVRLTKQGFSEEVIAMLGVGTMFTATSSLFLGIAIIGRKKQKTVDSLQTQHPESPWMWNEDWADGRVSTSAPVAVIVSWVFALIFTAISVPVTVAIIRTALDEGLHTGLIGLLFPLASLGLLAGAIYATARWLKYGQSHCDLITNPGVIGGWFRGAVHTRLRIGPNDEVKVRLSNIRRYTTGSGDNKSTHRDVKWQEEQTLAASALRRIGNTGSLVPAAFYIPRDCSPTNAENPRDEILWELELSAEVPGVDYKAQFDIPVFVTPESSEQLPSGTDEAYELTEEEVADYGMNSKIRVRPATSGGTEIYVPPRRAIGPAIGLSIFAIIWSMSIVMIIALGAPILFLLVFGFFEILIVWITIHLWFATTWTIFQGDSIEIKTKMLAFGRTHTLNTSDVEKVDLNVGMESNGTAYYRVQLHLHNKKKHNVATAIRDKNEARWLVSVIETCLEAQ